MSEKIQTLAEILGCDGLGQIAGPERHYQPCYCARCRAENQEVTFRRSLARNERIHNLLTKDRKR
jgi:hypothetical protein